MLSFSVPSRQSWEGKGPGLGAGSGWAGNQREGLLTTP